MQFKLFQFLFGVAVVLFGAYLIGRWAVGLALAIIGIVVLGDALLRNIDMAKPKAETVEPPEPKTLEEIFERAGRSQ